MEASELAPAIRGSRRVIAGDVTRLGVIRPRGAAGGVDREWLGNRSRPEIIAARG